MVDPPAWACLFRLDQMHQRNPSGGRKSPVFLSPTGDLRPPLGKAALFTLILLGASFQVPAADPRVGLRPAHGVALDNHVESIAPPVVERGKTTRVTFTGRDLGAALDLWHSLPAGALKA